MDPLSTPPRPPVHTDVLIVGAGPIGLELAVALKRHEIPLEIVEAGAIGQTMTWWAPQTRWFSSNERIAIAGVPLLTADQSKATREEYLLYLRGVAKQFELPVRCYEPVTQIERGDSGFTVATEAAGGTTLYACRAVVLATGGTDHPRRLGIPGEDLPHVDAYLREPHRYFGRRVLIIGGRNSAAEAALRLHHAGADVSICYRGTELPEDGIKYWLLPELRSLIQAGRIGCYLNARPVEISARHVVIETIGVEPPGTPLRVEADHVLSLIGYQQDKTLFQLAGIELVDTSQRPQVHPQTMESNIPGIYVAGTAIAGNQASRYRLFLENCHEHVDKIVTHLTGQELARRDLAFEQQIAARPES